MKTSTETLGLRRRLALELARLQTQSLRRKHPLRQLFWESTVRCNLRCRHCGSDCRLSAATPDMPREDFMRVLDSIAQRTDPGRIFIILGYYPADIINYILNGVTLGLTIMGNITACQTTVH